MDVQGVTGAIIPPGSTLTVTGRSRADELRGPGAGAVSRAAVNIRVLARLSLACLIAGFGLLNIADGNWAHVRRVACLIGFVVLGFGAVVLSALDEQPSNR